MHPPPPYDEHPYRYSGAERRSHDISGAVPKLREEERGRRRHRVRRILRRALHITGKTALFIGCLVFPPIFIWWMLREIRKVLE